MFVIDYRRVKNRGEEGQEKEKRRRGEREGDEKKRGKRRRREEEGKEKEKRRRGAKEGEEKKRGKRRRVKNRAGKQLAVDEEGGGTMFYATFSMAMASSEK